MLKIFQGFKCRQLLQNKVYATGINMSQFIH